VKNQLTDFNIFVRRTLKKFDISGYGSVTFISVEGKHNNSKSRKGTTE